jgi:phosphoribosylglycinamide formyltransferase-1
MSKTLRLAVLISGNGSNLQAIIDAIEARRLEAEIAVVVSNEADAPGLERAARHGLQSRVIDHRQFTDRDRFDDALRDCIAAFEPDLILLAGFMRILGPRFIAAFADRILNIHPSLLPAYKGLDTYQRALDNNETVHGVSIHLVTAELDDGPVIVQASYPIEPGDDSADMQRKGLRLEHLMYPRVIGWLGEGKLAIRNGQVFHEQAPLEAPLQFHPRD